MCLVFQSHTLEQLGVSKDVRVTSDHGMFEENLKEGDIGVCGIAVLANFSCGISVILILNCGIAVFSKPAGCVFFTFWSTIFGIKPYPSLFSDHWSPFIAVFGRLGSTLKRPYFVTHFNLQFDCFNNPFKAVPLFPRSHRSFLPLFLLSRQGIHQLYRLTIKLRYFPIYFAVLRYLSNFFAVMRCSATPNVPLLKKHLSKKMLAVCVFKHFESFRSIQFEFGKTGRILIGYSGCTSSQASSNTSEHYSIRGVHRSLFGRIRARIFGFLRSASSLGNTNSVVMGQWARACLFT